MLYRYWFVIRWSPSLDQVPATCNIFQSLVYLDTGVCLTVVQAGLCSQSSMRQSVKGYVQCFFTRCSFKIYEAVLFTVLLCFLSCFGRWICGCVAFERCAEVWGIHLVWQEHWDVWWTGFYKMACSFIAMNEQLVYFHVQSRAEELSKVVTLQLQQQIHYLVLIVHPKLVISVSNG